MLISDTIICNIQYLCILSHILDLLDAKWCEKVYHALIVLIVYFRVYTKYNSCQSFNFLYYLFFKFDHEIKVNVGHMWSLCKHRKATRARPCSQARRNERKSQREVSQSSGGRCPTWAGSSFPLDYSFEADCCLHLAPGQTTLALACFFSGHEGSKLQWDPARAGGCWAQTGRHGSCGLFFGLVQTTQIGRDFLRF